MKKNYFKNKAFYYILVVTFLIILISQLLIKDKYLINLTVSLPVGIYKIERSDRNFKIGDIVTFNTKNYPNIFKYSKAPKDITFSKYIRGQTGDNIKIDINKIYINNVYMGIVKTKDSRNNSLPQLENKNFTVKENEVFLLGVNDYSYDSRYYGSIKIDDILYKIRPVFVFNFKNQ